MSRQQAIGVVSSALSFLSSVVKSGEPWSSDCETFLREAQQALVALGQDEFDRECGG